MVPPLSYVVRRHDPAIQRGDYLERAGELLRTHKAYLLDANYSQAEDVCRIFGFGAAADQMRESRRAAMIGICRQIGEKFDSN